MRTKPCMFPKLGGIRGCFKEMVRDSMRARWRDKPCYDVTLPDLARCCDAFYLGGTKLGRDGIGMAQKLKEGFQLRGYTFAWDSPTNQQFLLLEHQVAEKWKHQVAFSIWKPADETHTVVRFVTSWATQEEELEALWKIVEGT